MPEHRFKDYGATKFKNLLNADILIALNKIEKAFKHPVDKARVSNYKVALACLNNESSLPMGLCNKGPRAVKQHKVMCVHALLTALIQEWWAFCNRPTEEAIRCYEYIEELKAIAKHGIEKHVVLGSLRDGFYLFRK